MKEKFMGTKDDSIALIKADLDKVNPSKKNLNDILQNNKFKISNNKALFIHIISFFFERYKNPEIPKVSEINIDLNSKKLKQYYDLMEEIMKTNKDTSLKRYYEYAKLLIEMSRSNNPTNTYFPFDED